MDAHAPAEPRVFQDLEIALDRGTILRHLGYPRDAAVRPDVDRLVDVVLQRSRGRLAPRGVYTIRDVVEILPRRLTIQGNVAFRGAIGQFIGMAKRAAVFVATVGDGPEILSREFMAQGRTLAGMIADVIGSEAAEAAAEAIGVRIRGEAEGEGMTTTMRYSPGYCGMEISEQRGIFDVLDGTTVGVSLNDLCVMNPVKSVSGLIGIGDPDAIRSFGSPCRYCGKADCPMRREE